MQSVNVHEAKTHLSKLLEQVQKGEEIVIARAGMPIARLIAYQPGVRKIAPPGAMAGEIWIGEDFDHPLDEQFDCLQQSGP
ncbi:Antitoxin of toxin-antitoxin stability system [Candidatus Accumulibacter aalborgensis]|uniref:Antitoxin n=1 Tax=Candidatus Accumulibacter aalborgensis TaxID=1860102 RepID=A0A1A8XTB3_9PROT|nr:type II toxin-antitoxin system Phd/YefM family antitoxin [Candidatus Accumulibacter aalborgensis]SBT08305.1 Antitoxin of toxin-antitoxin stability system [Candidatus Accumulibacter aalborgensis]